MEELQNIKKLLEKYYAGQTSPEEEAQLTHFFNTTPDAGELESHRAAFVHTFQLQNQTAGEDFKANLLQQFEKEKPKPPLFLLQRRWLNAAAIILLLVIAFGLGRMTQPRTESAELAALQTEIQSLRTMVMLALFDQPRASERLRAVRMVEEWNQPAQKAIRQLIRAMNEDDNVNVRLAAIEVLYAFRELPGVQQALLRSLPQQDSPIVQMELLRVLQSLNFRPDDKILFDLLEDPELDPDVKNQIQQMMEST